MGTLPAFGHRQRAQSASPLYRCFRLYLWSDPFLLSCALSRGLGGSAAKFYQTVYLVWFDRAQYPGGARVDQQQLVGPEIGQEAMETASPAGLCRGHCPDLSSIDRRQRALVYLAMVALPSCRVGRCPAHQEILDQENSRRAGVESLVKSTRREDALDSKF